MVNAGLMIAMAAPVVLMMRWAGRVSDRFDSRRVLLVAVGVQICACILLVTAVDYQPYWLLYFSCVIYQTGYSFANPVWMALIPRIVGEHGVQRLAGIQLLVGSLATPIGAALGGVLVETTGFQAVPLVSSIALIIVGFCAWAIGTRRKGTDRATLPLRTGGLSYIRNDKVLVGTLVGVVIAALVIQGVNVVEVYLVRKDLGVSAAQYGLTKVFFASGTIIASLLVSHLSSDRQRAWAISGGFACCAVALILMSRVESFSAYLAFDIVLGFGNAMINGALGPLFLLRTSEANRGKVSATLNGVLSTSTIFALIIGGVSGEWLDPRQIYLIAGTFSIPVIVGMGITTIPASYCSTVND